MSHFTMRMGLKIHSWHAQPEDAYPLTVHHSVYCLLMKNAEYLATDLALLKHNSCNELMVNLIKEYGTIASYSVRDELEYYVYYAELAGIPMVLINSTKENDLVLPKRYLANVAIYGSLTIA